MLLQKKKKKKMHRSIIKGSLSQTLFCNYSAEFTIITQKRSKKIKCKYNAKMGVKAEFINVHHVMKLVVITKILQEHFAPPTTDSFITQ